MKKQFLLIAVVAFTHICAACAQVFPELGYDQLFPLELWIVIFLICLIGLILLVIIWVWFGCTISRQNRDYREFKEALIRNRQRKLHNRRRVQEWVETENNAEPPEPSRRHGNVSSNSRIRHESQEEPSRQPKLSQTRSPPQAITYRRDNTEPRQLYVSVDYVRTLVSEQQQQLQQQQQQLQSSSRYAVETQAVGTRHVHFPMTEDPDLPSYNEIMLSNSPDFYDESEQIQMMDLYAQGGQEAPQQQ